MTHNSTTIAAQANQTPTNVPETLSGADIILRVLAEQGVDTMFGYSGGAILPTYDAVFRHNETQAAHPERQIKFIVPANEQAAGFMAAGYARASGKVGVFMVTSGPGATNAVTPIADCNGDSIPVVLICGQVPRAAIGSDAFQEAPVFNIMSACAKQVFLVVRRETGKEERVKVPDYEDLANHVVPESCAMCREAHGEALTGVRIGQPLSHDRTLIPGADVVTSAEGNTTERATASAPLARRGLRPWHARTLLTREPGDLSSGQRQYGLVRVGKARSRSR